MSMGPCLDAVKARLAGFTAWPARWQNETFEGIPIDNDGNPIDADGNKIAFLECTLIGGKNRLRSFGVPGQRTSIHPGLIRFYLCVPGGTGTVDAYTQADALSALFEETAFGQTATSSVRTYGASVSENVATYMDGSYWVLQVSIDTDFYYIV